MTRAIGAVCLLAIAVVMLTGATGVSAQPITWTHFAGSTGGSGAVDGEPAAARFDNARALVVDAAGNVYVAAGAAIRRVDPTGEVTTFAGLSGHHSSGDGARHAARFYNPSGTTIDPAGNLFVADGTSAIRRITPSGIVTTLAGSQNTVGSADGTGGAARFFNPQGIAYAPGGFFYVADTNNHTIRKVTAAGVVTTFAGSPGAEGTADGTGAAARFRQPNALTVDAAGNVYVVDGSNFTIRRITPAGVVTTLAGTAGACGYDDGTGSAARFCYPNGIVADPATGNLYVTSDGRIRQVTPAGVVTTFAGSIDGGSTNGTGTAARFAFPWGIAIDGDGNLYVTELYGDVIRKITPGAFVSTLAGRTAVWGFVDATGVSARFSSPVGLARDTAGNILVADDANTAIRQITPAGVVTTIAGSPGSSAAVDGPLASATFGDPTGLAVDASNRIYVAEKFTHVIRRIADGNVTTLAGSPNQAGATNATGSDARFNNPSDLVVDAAGNVYVADSENHAIRRITPAGVVTTFAGEAGTPGALNATGGSARFQSPGGIAMDASGNLYVADTGNYAIRKITPAGVVTTYAGGLGVPGNDDGSAATARFYDPMGIDVMSDGTLIVAEPQMQRIRRIATDGTVTTIGGSAQMIGTQHGTGNAARFDGPTGIAIGADGAIYVADRFGHAIRRGVPGISTVAAIDLAWAPAGLPRQLSATAGASSWGWSVIRRPTGSSATISGPGTANPTFTPDVPDLYTFKLIAVGASGNSITTVDFIATCPTITIGPSILSVGRVGSAYSRTISATGGTAPFTYSIVSGSVAPGLTFDSTGLLSGTPTTAGSYTFTVRATDFYGCSTTRAYTHDVWVLAPPANVVATATGTTSVQIQWDTVPDAAGYRVYRRQAGGSFASIGTAAAPPFNDSGRAANTAYLYFVRAYNGSNEESPDSNRDFATTVVFTDPSLSAGTTPIKAVHLHQLRTAVAAMRALAGLAPSTFTDASPVTGLPVRSVHFTQIRTALSDAHVALGWPATTIDLTPEGAVVAASHVMALRHGTQ